MSKQLLLLAFLGLSAFGQYRVALGDWPEQRGPNRDGISKETGLPDQWTLNGENMLWRVPYGGRSAPVIMGNHLYVQNPSGRGADEQERVMCLNPDTGKVIWEYKFNIFQSDAPAHRVGWASPAVDVETGNVYAIGAGGFMVALNKDGKRVWDRSIGEEFGAFTTHGGRMTSPLIDGNLVMVSLAVSTWGKESNRAQRIIALDKRNGEIVWVSNPGGRPYDTAYAGMNITLPCHTSCQFRSHVSPVVAASAARVLTSSLSNFSSASALLVGTNGFQLLSALNSILSLVSVESAHSPAKSVRCPTRRPRLMDLGWGLKLKSASAGMASIILRVFAASRSNSAISSF